MFSEGALERLDPSVEGLVRPFPFCDIVFPILLPSCQVILMTQETVMPFLSSSLIKNY